MAKKTDRRLNYYVPSVSLVMFAVFLVMAVLALLSKNQLSISAESAGFFAVLALLCLLFQPLYHTIPRLSKKKK